MATELDYMEYANDGAAQSAYVTSEEFGAASLHIDYNPLLASTAYNVEGGSGTNESLAQEFQPTAAIWCSKIAARAHKNGNPTDNVICRIETDNAGVPSGSLVHANATKTISAAGLPGGAAWIDFEFPAPFQLSSGTPYHIVMTRSGGRDVSNNFRWQAKVPGSYADGDEERKNSGSWSNYAEDFFFRVYLKSLVLQCYSENAIKVQGSYSLKGFADQTNSLNDTLTRTVGPTIDLTGVQTIKFDIYSSRTGANIKVGIHDSGGTTSEKTHTQVGAGGWETVTWDISGVSDANKDAIDSIIITIVNADADNTFYIDNMYAEDVVVVGGNAIFFGANF